MCRCLSSLPFLVGCRLLCLLLVVVFWAMLPLRVYCCGLLLDGRRLLVLLCDDVVGLKFVGLVCVRMICYCPPRMLLLFFVVCCCLLFVIVCGVALWFVV